MVGLLTAPALSKTPADISVSRSGIQAMADRAKGTPEASLLQGRLAYLNYDFTAAEKHYKTYAASKKKSKEGAEMLDVFEQQLEIARESMENVQRLRLIARKSVPSEDFLGALRLPSSAGRLLSADSIPTASEAELPQMVYASENGSYRIWAEGDSFLESERLTDGSWQTPVALEGLGDALAFPDFPFLRADGASLYFASEGVGSMGGYDLFVAGRDTETGEFMAPRNLGMPFNSPFDDYLVAIDDHNGLAWLVSDREQKDGEVTVYLYIYEENRTNHDPEDESLTAHAALSAPDDYLNPDNPEAKARLAALEESLRPSGRTGEDDFVFYLPEGKRLRRVGDFHSPAARVLAGKYRDALQEHAGNELTLSRLRAEYHQARKDHRTEKLSNLGQRILNLEKALEASEIEIRSLRSQTADME